MSTRVTYPLWMLRSVARSARIAQDTPTEAIAEQTLTKLRMIHLDPASVAIKFNGRHLGQTPATLDYLPARTISGSGGWRFACALLQESRGSFEFGEGFWSQFRAYRDAANLQQQQWQDPPVGECPPLRWTLPR